MIRFVQPYVQKIVNIFRYLRLRSQLLEVNGQEGENLEVTDDPLGELIGAGTKGLLVRASPGWAAAPRGIGQTLQGSVSAVSKPIFASKHAFESSRRDLHNALLCTALQSQFFAKKIVFLK